MMDIDALLLTGRRGLRTRPGSLLLGPTGARLWAEMLEDRPGFSGAIDFIHKINIPLLFGIDHESPKPPLPSDVEWRPSHLTTRSRFGTLTLEERRYVNWEDQAVSLQRWHNGGSEPTVLKLRVDTDWVSVEGNIAVGERRIDAHAGRCSDREAAGRADTARLRAGGVAGPLDGQVARRRTEPLC